MAGFLSSVERRGRVKARLFGTQTHGAEVLIVGRRDDVLEEAVGRLKAVVPNGKVFFQVCDITVTGKA